ncbi:MAG TPA: type II secretion system F family protein, partial [Candidatus Paceibacterota bacterium]|nr:type II secretion system F family protein [Candidatus Paceibacterota bacterium]
MEFRYHVQDSEGKALRGIVDAPDQDAAVAALHERGFTVLSLEEVKRGLFEGGDINQLLNRPKTKDVVVFTRQLSTLIEADVPLAEGMRTMAQQTDNPNFARIISDVSERLEGGTSLSGAFAAHPKLFSQFYVKLIRSGEVSGRLQQTLLYLADYLERNQAILSKVRNALAYPAFIVVAMVAVALIMAVYVLPQLLVIFEESGAAELPITTRLLIATTNFINDYIFLVLGFIVFVVFGFRQWLKSEEGGAQWDAIKIKVPIFGTILKSLYLARLAENLATLVKSDIAILDALRVTADVVDNAIYRDILLHAEEQVRGGGAISDVFRQYPGAMPSLMSSMIAIGERTGKLDTMLGHVSKFYRTESENRIDSIASLVEPVIVVILGIGVAVLVSSILLPLYSLVN